MNDAEMLDKLTEIGNRSYPELKWVCRDSTQSSGIRLHQYWPNKETNTLPLTGVPMFDTPREAIEAYLKGKMI